MLTNDVSLLKFTFASMQKNWIRFHSWKGFTTGLGSLALPSLSSWAMLARGLFADWVVLFGVHTISLLIFPKIFKKEAQS